MASKRDLIADKDRFTILYPEFTGKCCLCGSTDRVSKHEAFFGTANRTKSKTDGLIYELCYFHHQAPKTGVHSNKELDNRLKIQAEKIWLNTYTDKNDSFENRVKKFIDRYGKNYIMDDSI